MFTSIRFKSLAAVFVGAFAALGALMSVALPVYAESHGSLIGVPIGSQVTIGPGGNTNRIDVIFDTQDGLTWTVRCTRDEQNLGLCSNLSMGFYQADGQFIVGNTVLTPQSMTFMSKQQSEKSLNRVPVLTTRYLSGF